MTHRYNILNLFLLALVLLLPSCISLEDYEIDADCSDAIEFVCRQTSYDGQAVLTKATSANDFENKVHNCYFMLYDKSGDLKYGPIDLEATLTTQRFSKSDFKKQVGNLATYTACFVANVSKSIVDGLTTLQKVNSTVLDIAYSSADVLDTENSSKPSSFMIPEFVLKEGEEAVQCLPMFGMQECNVANGDIFQISLKRLFAKVSVKIGVSASLASFDLLAAHLHNLPIKVKLVESGNESNWVTDSDSFLLQQIEGPIDDDDISGGVSGILTNAYEFYFYVPEYYLSPTNDRSGNYGDEKFKPNMYDKDKFPIKVKLFGKYKESSLSTKEQDVTYDLYLGEDASTSFTLKRNMFYKNLLEINGIKNSIDGKGNTLDCRVDVSELDEIEVLGQTANCYIIAKTGTYIYPACKGVWKGGLSNIPDELKCTKGTTLKILYRDNDGIELDNLAFNQESCEFSFNVTAIDNGTGLIESNDGNIILGLVYTEDNKEKIEWSWHLWFVDGAILGVDAFEVESNTYPSGKSLMDRNLGARMTLLFKSTPGVADGLYYKYGHKDPYIVNNYYGGGESESYIWNDTEKSQTDPCPPGYRVPQSTAWSGNATKEHAAIPNVVEAFRYWNMDTEFNIFDDIYYPYSGYVDSNKKLQSQGYDKRDTTRNYSVKIPTSQSDLSATSKYYYNYIDALGYSGAPVIFTNVEYSKYNIDNLGYLRGTDYDIEYSYKEAGIEIIKCTVQVGKWEGSGGFLGMGKKYKAVYNNPAENLTGDQLISKYKGSYDRLISVLNGGTGSNTEQIGDAIKGLFISPTVDFSSSKTINTDKGYPIRCVKE